MAGNLLKTLFSVLISFICLLGYSQPEAMQQEKHLEVALRMIGHQVLLDAGDSTSRVLPIIENEGQYLIQFDTEFNFNPESLVSTVRRVALETQLADNYIVELVDCESDHVVYSFKIAETAEMDIIPCRTRDQVMACYNMQFTLIGEIDENEAEVLPSGSLADTGRLNYYIALSILLLGLVGAYIWKRRQRNTIDPNVLVLGAYQFDKRNTELILGDQRIKLTGKEAELLTLLYEGANTTIERDVLLNMIWGDEGDYVGRTLDVFISKLRKKLEFDSNLKIENIRGVGYKLVLNV